VHSHSDAAIYAHSICTICTVLRSLCGTGTGPHGACCAPDGVVPAGAYERPPNAERQAYDPMVVETTFVKGADGKETVASKKIIQGGRGLSSTTELLPSAGSAGSSVPDAAATAQHQQRHLRARPVTTARPTPAPTTAKPSTAKPTTARPTTAAPTTAAPAAPVGSRTRKVSAAHRLCT
jgi:hypothetical protein